MNGYRQPKSEQGFSIMELIVVMVLMLIILGAVFSLMRGTITTANANFEMGAATQSLRNSQEYLTRDILVAGDGLRGLANVWLPTSFVTTNLTVRPASAIDPLNSGFVNVGIISSDDNVPAGTVISHVAPALNVLPNTDRLTLMVRDVTFSPIDLAAGSVAYNSGVITVPAARTGDFAVGEVYFLSNGISAVFGTVTAINGGANQITWADGDQWGINRNGPSGFLSAITKNGTSPTVLQRVQIVHYFADANQRLVRRVFGVKGGGFVDNVVAEHVRTLQFRYALNPTGTGQILDPPIPQINFGQAALVRTIEQSIIVETAHTLHDGEIHDVEGTTAIGVRNLQFGAELRPRDALGNTDLPNPGPTPVITPTPPPPTPPPTPPPATPTPTVSPTP